jgi:hypothetical protein
LLARQEHEAALLREQEQYARLAAAEREIARRRQLEEQESAPSPAASDEAQATANQAVPPRTPSRLPR